MKFILFGLTLLFPLFGISQEKINGKVMELHSSVGSVITVDEKQKFNLFPEYKDSLFQSAMLIMHADSTYAFLIKPTVRTQSFERETNLQEMDEMKKKIEQISPSPSISYNDSTQIYYSNKENSQLSPAAQRVALGVLDFVIRGILYIAINEAFSGSSSYSPSVNDKPSGNTVYAPRGKKSSSGKGKRK